MHKKLAHPYEIQSIIYIYICTYIIILLRFERINERTKVFFFFNVEITFHNSLCTHIEEFLDDARPSISEKRVQLP